MRNTIFGSSRPPSVDSAVLSMPRRPRELFSFDEVGCPLVVDIGVSRAVDLATCMQPLRRFPARLAFLALNDAYLLQR